MFEENESYKENLRRLKEIALAKGYLMNPDSERMNKVIGMMSKNFIKFGEYICPCKQNDPDNTGNKPSCPCSEIDQEIAKNGYCYCKLFYKGET